MTRTRIGLSIFLGLLLGSLPFSATAQLEVGGDLISNCAEIEALRKKGELNQARDKARLCLDGLEQELEGAVGKHFLEQVGAWKRVGFEQANAMGFQNTTARYAKEDKTVTVSLTGGSGGRGLGGALSGLARMGMMGGGKQVRVAGLPALVTPDGQVLVTLTDGSMLTFDCPALLTADDALAGMGDLIDAFPVKAIDETLTES